MVMDYLNHMSQYDELRNCRYKGYRKEYFPISVLYIAFDAWKNAIPGVRGEEWDLYCDIRDGYEIGTNAKIRLRIQSSNLDPTVMRYARKESAH